MDLDRRAEYRQALGVYQQMLPLPDVSHTLEFHAYLLDRMANIEIELGGYREAENKANDAIAMLRQAQRTQSGIYVFAERTLADALHAEGYDQQAKPIAEQALSLARQVYPPASENLALTQTSLGQVLMGLGDLHGAEQLCRRALEIFQKMELSREIDLGTAYQNLAVVEAQRGHAKEALVTINLALTSWDHVLPPDHPFIVYALNTKLTAYAKLRAFEQGEELIPHMLRLGKSRFSPDHPERVILLNNAAAFYTAEKCYAKAEPLLREAVATGKRCFNAGHPTLRSTLLNYAYVLGQLNRKDDAAVAKAESEIIQVDRQLDRQANPPPNAFQ